MFSGSGPEAGGDVPDLRRQACSGNPGERSEEVSQPGQGEPQEERGHPVLSWPL